MNHSIVPLVLVNFLAISVPTTNKTFAAEIGWGTEWGDRLTVNVTQEKWVPELNLDEKRPESYPYLNAVSFWGTVDRVDAKNGLATVTSTLENGGERMGGFRGEVSGRKTITLNVSSDLGSVLSNYEKVCYLFDRDSKKLVAIYIDIFAAKFQGIEYTHEGVTGRWSDAGGIGTEFFYKPEVKDGQSLSYDSPSLKFDFDAAVMEMMYFWMNGAGLQSTPIFHVFVTSEGVDVWGETSFGNGADPEEEVSMVKSVASDEIFD